VLRHSSTQLQKYKAAHSKRAVNTQRYDRAMHKFEKMAARISRRIAVEQRRYAAARWDGGHPGLTV